MRASGGEWRRNREGHRKAGAALTAPLAVAVAASVRRVGTHGATDQETVPRRSVLRGWDYEEVAWTN